MYVVFMQPGVVGVISKSVWLPPLKFASYSYGSLDASLVTLNTILCYLVMLCRHRIGYALVGYLLSFYSEEY